MSHNSAYENQYLETDRYNLENESLESMESLFENYERGDFEDNELFESGENWESGETLGEHWEAGQFETGIPETGLFEGNYEGQHEGQYEGQMEGDRFLGGLFKIAKPLLKQVVPKLAGTVGSALGGQRAGQIAQALANNVLREAELEGDRELNPEGDPEMQMESLGVDREILAEMSYLAEQAANAESLQEADRFLGAIAGLAGKILPSLLGETDREGMYEGEEEGDRFLPLLPLAAMAGKALLGKGAAKIGGKLLGRGIRTLGRSLFRSRRTRPLIRTLPRILNRTVVRVNNAVQGAPASRPITPPVMARTVVSAFPRAIATTLATPVRVNQALYRNRLLARRYRISGSVTLRPVRRIRPY